MTTIWEIDLLQFPRTKRIGEVAEALKKAGAANYQTPFLVRMLEHPRFSFFGRNFMLFPGAVSSDLHDRIHIILARNFLPTDEAFVIGFTMGSTQKFNKLSQRLFALICKNLYPIPYRFDDDCIAVFYRAVKLGSRLSTADFSKLDIPKLDGEMLYEARARLISRPDDLTNEYLNEAERFPSRKESVRLRKALNRPRSSHRDIT